MQQIGKYKVLKKLGSGSFGFVYLAEDPKLDVQVAIKVFKVKDLNLLSQMTTSSVDPEDVIKKRFIEEARALRKLSTNPYIVQMYEFNELEDGTPYYVMPFVARTLVDEIGKDAFSQGALDDIPTEKYPRRIPVSQAVNYLNQLAQALCAVHENGLVHRDIKPANILINKHNQVQLCDFGIAKLPMSEHSQTGFGMGSKNYMSPEQQESAKHVKPTSDIYGLGVLAYRMITGQLPIGRYHDPIDYAPEMGQVLNDLIVQCISPIESQRPANGATFLAELNHAIQLKENSNPIVNEETTTWVSKNGNKIKAEFFPLEKKIIELLKKQGEIKSSDLSLLQALADLYHIDSAGLKVFIHSIIQQQSDKCDELQKFVLWMNTVNERFSVNNQILSKADIHTLIEAGMSTTNKTAIQLKRLIADKQNKIDTLTFAERSMAYFKHFGKQFGYIVLFLIFITSFLVIYDQDQKEKIVTKSDLDAYSSAKKTNTVTGYEFYLKNWPVGEYIIEVEKKLADLLLMNQISTNNKNTLRMQQIENTQHQLIKQGYQVSKTGKLDKRTKHAIEAFEKSENLLITGDIDDLLLKKLILVYNEKDENLWQYVKKEHSINAYQNYIDTFADGQYVTLANQYIKKINTDRLTAAKQRQEAQEKQRQLTIDIAIRSLLENMVTIPSGNFIMGCERGLACKTKEMPMHKVYLSTYTIMASEVTFALWDACIISGYCGLQPDDQGWGRGDRPVMGVNYNDIVEEFIPWLNKATGEYFSLPSEAQWEYAARAHSTTDYSWGNDIDCTKARYSQFRGICGNERKTSEVKSFIPNEFGLYDMHGNVWEWTKDCWNNNYNGAPTDGSSWNSGDCDSAVIRGGSWLNDASFLHTYSRSGYSRSIRSNVNGFRLIIDIKPD